MPAVNEPRPQATALKLAVIGIRGLPPLYGGAETASDELGRRLVRRGHEVTVYCRLHNAQPPRPREHGGVRLVHLPSLHTKHLDTPTHIALCALHAIAIGRPQLVLLSGVGTWFVMPLLQLFGIRCVMWADGKDWERQKWGRLARRYLLWSARQSVRCADAIVTDTRIGQETYREKLGRETDFIPFGAPQSAPGAQGELERWGLQSGQYLLFVGRLIPEKGVHYLLSAFARLSGQRRLVIVGDNPYNPSYVASLKASADPRVLFTGYVFGDGFLELMQGCRLYVQPSDVEGNSPVLLTAMALGRPVIVNGIPENLETIGAAGLSFSPGDVAELTARLGELVEDEARLRELGAAALARVRTHYDWDTSVLAFEALFRRLLASVETAPLEDVHA